MTFLRPRRRCFAVIPAAGASSRMGRPKLTLPWGESTVIEQVLKAWLAAAVDKVVVVVRGDDRELVSACRRYPVEIVVGAPPPIDMAMSIGIGLRAIQTRYSPSTDDAWLAAPADVPGISSAVIERLCGLWRTQTGENIRIGQGLVCQLEDRPTHPVLLPWTAAIGWLDEGVDRGESPRNLRDRIKLQTPWPVDSDDLISRAELRDLDTPDDYRRGTDNSKQGGEDRSKPPSDDVQS
jgi:molybdenum cofactor cytidylyltransferase